MLFIQKLCRNMLTPLTGTLMRLVGDHKKMNHPPNAPEQTRIKLALIISFFISSKSL